MHSASARLNSSVFERCRRDYLKSRTAATISINSGVSPGANFSGRSGRAVTGAPSGGSSVVSISKRVTMIEIKPHLHAFAIALCPLRTLTHCDCRGRSSDSAAAATPDAKATRDAMRRLPPPVTLKSFLKWGRWLHRPGRSPIKAESLGELCRIIRHFGSGIKWAESFAIRRSKTIHRAKGWARP